MNYQLVTDHTAMVVLDDTTFNKRGIERRNQTRIANEVAAQSIRAAAPAKTYQVDAAQPTYTAPAPHVSHGGGGGGGGALTRDDILKLAVLVLFIAAARHSRRLAHT